MVTTASFGSNGPLFAKNLAMMKRTLFVKTLFISTSILWNLACDSGGPKIYTDQSLNDPTTETGDYKVEMDPKTGEAIVIPYTTAGSVEDFQNLKNNMAKRIDKALAQNIRDVRVQFVNSNELQIDLELIDDTHTYKLTSTDGKTFAAQAPVMRLKSDDLKYTLSANCVSSLCKVAHFYLKQISGKKISDATFQYSIKKPQVSVLVPEEEQYQPQVLLTEFRGTQHRPLEAEQRSFVVVGGRSQSKIEVKRDKKVIAILNTELLDTSEKESQVSIDKESLIYNNNTTKAELVGNDPNSGSLIIDLNTMGPIEESVRLIFENDYPQYEYPKVPVGQAPPLPSLQPEKPSFDFVDKNILAPVRPTEEIKKTYLQFNTYVNNPTVKQLIDPSIKEWQRECGKNCWHVSKDRAEKFLSNVRPLENLTRKIMQSEGISPEYAYILGYESQFFDGDYKVQVTAYDPKNCNACTAAGPWQIIKKTAIDFIENHSDLSQLNYSIFPIQGKGSKRSLDPRDDRGYYLQATHIASKLLADLNKRYSNDPGLVILAYTLGTGVVNDIQKRLRGLRNYGTSFATVARYNMAKREKIYYTKSIIALRIIGQDPMRYNITLNKNVDTSGLKGKISNPSRQLPEFLDASDLRI